MLRTGAAQQPPDDGSSEPLQSSTRNGDLLRAYHEQDKGGDAFEMPTAPLPPPPPLPLPPPINDAEPDSSLLRHGGSSLSEIRAPFAIPDDDPFGQPRKASADSSQGSNKCRRRTKSMTCNMVSALYGRMAVVITTVLVLTEVMDNSVPLLRFHGYLYAYLLGGSVVCLLGVYVSTMVDRCPALSGQAHSNANDPEAALRRGRVMTSCSSVSIYLRIGVIVFGLGTLMSCGLEIATIFTLSKPCTDPVNLAMPVLHALFTFLQMHFVFMNAQGVARSLGCLRHLVLVHLVVTNVAVWLKLLLWETASEWLRQSHVLQDGEAGWPPKDFNFTTHVIDGQGEHKAYFTSDCLWRSQEEMPMERMLTLQRCLHNSTVGAIWHKAAPFLTPFVVQYSVVGAVVVYTIWDNYSYCTRGKNHNGRRPSPTSDQIELPSSERVFDCQSSSKGLFLGLLVLVAGIIVLILFFVLSNENMEVETLSAVTTLHCAVQGLSVMATAIGLCKVGGTYHKRGRLSQLNSILQGIGLLAVYTYGAFGVVAGASNVLRGSEHLLLLLDGAFMVLFASLQSLFAQRLAMRCLPKKNGKAGLQVVTFLMFSNLVLWLLETFTSQNHISSQQQLAMYGTVSWGIISRVALPLVIFYRFHSCVFLMEAWQLPISLARGE